MALTIVVRSGNRSPARQITFDAPRLVIGRGEGCEVRLPDPSVSHRHASVRQRGSEYIIVDEGSTNGTFVGPVRLSPQAPRVVQHGDFVRVGRVWLEVRIEQAMPTQNSAIATKELALSLVAEALAAQGEASTVRVIVTNGPAAGAELDVTDFDRKYVIGRGKRADLMIDDPDLSRRHVELVRRADRLLITDLGSKNGSTLDGVRLAANTETPWRPGSVLAIGEHAFAFENPARDALAEIERAADEKILPGETIDPPTGLEQENPSVGPPAPPAVSVSPRNDAGRPRPRRQVKRVQSTPSWRATDYLIALFALGVLAMSLAGLLWLIRQ